MTDLPPQPAYILRGHAYPIHATTFLRNNTRLVTGDAEGWVVMWDMDSRRAVAVWRAHDGGSLLGIGAWGGGRIITHGKDNKLIVWKLGPDEEAGMSTVLPIDELPAGQERRRPWILHILDVNTMNFCSFASCIVSPPPAEDQIGDEAAEQQNGGLLIAVPNTLTSESIDIFHLPTVNRVHNIPSPAHLKLGMVMCLSLFTHPSTQKLTVIAGYEDGHTVVFAHSSSSQAPWIPLLISHSHTQPILSLDVDPSPEKEFFLSSGADDRIVKYIIPSTCKSTSTSDSSKTGNKDPPKILQTAHSGQQSLRMRSDGKICVTAGWDGRVRVYGVLKMRELAVLKWHREGCYAVGFAEVMKSADEGGDGKEEKEGGKELVGRLGGVDVKKERLRRVRETHWVVVGSKDGKVSLWDIY